MVYGTYAEDAADSTKDNDPEGDNDEPTKGDKAFLIYLDFS